MQTESSEFEGGRCMKTSVELERKNGVLGIMGSKPKSSDPVVDAMVKFQYFPEQMTTYDKLLIHTYCNLYR